MKYFLTLFTILSLGCASIHNGDKAHVHSNNTNFIVSLERVDDYSDAAHSYYNVNVENKSLDWLRIKTVHFYKLDQDSKMNVIVGDDLLSWKESVDAKMAIQNYNAEIRNGFLVALGTIAIAASAGHGQNHNSSSSTANAGATAVIAGSTMSAAKNINDNLNEVENAKRVPSNHVYNSFSVPAQGFSRKWILIHSTEGIKKQKVAFDFETIDGDIHRVITVLK